MYEHRAGSVRNADPKMKTKVVILSAADTFVGPGCVVVRAVPDGQTVAGNPARPLSMKNLETHS